jgi:hypothetical protein
MGDDLTRSCRGSRRCPGEIRRAVNRALADEGLANHLMRFAVAYVSSAAYQNARHRELGSESHVR